MQIYQIEITNNCNFSCSYCPRPTKMTREVGVMSEATIDRIADIVENETVRLHHYGESLLHPDRALYAIKKLSSKGKKTILNTNGSLLNKELCEKLFDSGLERIYLSYHNNISLINVSSIQRLYRNFITIIKIAEYNHLNHYKEKLKTLKEIGYKVELKVLRDLGQVKKDGKGTNKCSFLIDNSVAVLWDGTIVPCCECYDNNYSLGNVNETNTVLNVLFEYCKTCQGYGNDNKETERIEL